MLFLLEVLMAQVIAVSNTAANIDYWVHMPFDMANNHYTMIIWCGKSKLLTLDNSGRSILILIQFYSVFLYNTERGRNNIQHKKVVVVSKTFLNTWFRLIVLNLSIFLSVLI